MFKKQKNYYNIAVGKLNVNIFTIVLVHIGCLKLYFMMFILIELLENVCIIVVFYSI